MRHNHKQWIPAAIVVAVAGIGVAAALAMQDRKATTVEPDPVAVEAGPVWSKGDRAILMPSKWYDHEESGGFWEPLTIPSTYDRDFWIAETGAQVIVVGPSKKGDEFIDVAFEDASVIRVAGNMDPKPRSGYPISVPVRFLHPAP